MTRLAQLKRRTLIFSGVIAVLAGWLVFRPAETSTQRTEDLPALVPGFSSENAAFVDLRQGGSVMTGGQERLVTLKQRRERDGSATWVVSSAFDYPANDTYVSRLLSELAKARIVGERTRREDTFSDYAQDGAWIEVKVKDASEKELATVGIGKSSWKTGETNVLLRQGGPARVVAVRNMSGDSAKVKPEAWFEARMFPGLDRDDVEAFEVLQKVELEGKVTTRKLAFTKRPQEAAKPPEPGKPPEPPPERGWDMTSPDPGQASRVDVEDLVHAFTGLLFEDVIDRPKGTDGDAKHGFDAPEIVATATLARARPEDAPQRVTLTIGKLDPATKKWSARRSGATWVFSLKDDERAVGRFRNDPSKFKEAPKPSAADAPKDGAPPPAPGDAGSPDGPGDGTPPKEPAPGAPGEPKPQDPKPGEPAPLPPPSEPGKPPEAPKSPEPAPSGPPDAPK